MVFVAEVDDASGVFHPILVEFFHFVFRWGNVIEVSSKSLILDAAIDALLRRQCGTSS